MYYPFPSKMHKYLKQLMYRVIVFLCLSSLYFVSVYLLHPYILTIIIILIINSPRDRDVTIGRIVLLSHTSNMTEMQQVVRGRASRLPSVRALAIQKVSLFTGYHTHCGSFVTRSCSYNH